MHNSRCEKGEQSSSGWSDLDDQRALCDDYTFCWPHLLFAFSQPKVSSCLEQARSNLEQRTAIGTDSGNQTARVIDSFALQDTDIACLQPLILARSYTGLYSKETVENTLKRRYDARKESRNHIETPTTLFSDFNSPWTSAGRQPPLCDCRLPKPCSATRILMSTTLMEFYLKGKTLA